MPRPTKYEPIVQVLINEINREKWEPQFSEAIEQAGKFEIPEMKEIKDFESYLEFINDLLHWAPTENDTAKNVYYKLCIFYFILDQPALQSLQSKIAPESAKKPLTWLSDWLVLYAQEVGKFLSTTDSISPETIETFRLKEGSDGYQLDDYLEPQGGWRTFNEFFARNFKPGHRPVKDVANQKVIVSPADSKFGGFWDVKDNKVILAKGIPWDINDLLSESEYASSFRNGVFMHAFLGPNDYHRQHAPVGGKVLEVKNIPGQVYLQVEVKDNKDGPGNKLVPGRKLTGHTAEQRSRRYASNDGLLHGVDAPDDAGYQFLQARGLIVLETEIGLVAVLPIGMAQVSSVVITAEKGVVLRKGEELSYFQFGGSDIVLVFEGGANVEFSAERNTHYKMGEQIAFANIKLPLEK